MARFKFAMLAVALLAAGASACTPDDLTTFATDFARQALAAFLI